MTLWHPPPLGRPLAVERIGRSAVIVRDGDQVVAEGVAATVQLEIPAAVTYEEAVLASQAYPGLEEHAFPTCFVCGPGRAPGDGLRIVAGVVPGRELVAAPWIPEPSFAGGGGAVRAEFLWATLFLMLAFIGPLEFLILLVIVVVFFGAKRVSRTGRSLARGMREFKGSITDKEGGELEELPEPPDEQKTAS